MATKALNYPTAEINQKLNLAGSAVQPNALNDYYTKTEVDGKVVVDLSARYTASYANLSAALTALNSDTAATNIKKAGVSIKFINSTTNKYEQWNLKASSWSTNTSDWALDVGGSVAQHDKYIFLLTDSYGRLIAELDKSGDCIYLANIHAKNYEADFHLSSNDAALYVLTDSLDRLLEYIKSDGTKQILIPVNFLTQPTYKGDKLVSENDIKNDKISLRRLESTIYPTNVPGFLFSLVDADNKLIECILSDGTKQSFVPVNFHVQPTYNGDKLVSNRDIADLQRLKASIFSVEASISELLVDKDGKALYRRDANGNLIHYTNVFAPNLATLNDLKPFLKKDDYTPYVITTRNRSVDAISYWYYSYMIGQSYANNIIVDTLLDENDRCNNSNQRMVFNGVDKIYTICYNNIEGTETGVEAMYEYVSIIDTSNNTLITHSKIASSGETVTINDVEYVIDQYYDSTINIGEDGYVYAIMSAKYNGKAAVVVKKLNPTTLAIISTHWATINVDGQNYQMNFDNFENLFGYGFMRRQNSQHFCLGTTGWQLYNNEYYCVCFCNPTTRGMVLKTSNFIDYDLFYLIPTDYKMMHEAAFYIHNSYLYIAIRTYSEGGVLPLIKVSLANMEIIDEVMVRSGMTPPYMFMYNNRLYLWCGGEADTTNKSSGRNYYKMIEVSLENGLKDSYIVADADDKLRPQNSNPVIIGDKCYLGYTGPKLKVGYFTIPTFDYSIADTLIRKIINL